MDNEPLFESDNPLTERLGDTFFEELPKTPGIYKMYGSAGQLLYVGKAKNLRNRLFTYRRAKPGRESRKVIRLVRMIYAIELEEMGDEEQALLRENQLIREYKPEFNHAKKQHEAYYYLMLQARETAINTHLRMHVREEDRAHTYGAFKGHLTVRRGVGALLRQLYIIEEEVKQPFALPSQLLKKLTPMHYELSADALLTQGWMEDITSFLEGRSDRFLYRLMEHAHGQSLLEAFIGKVVLKDMEALKYFYDRCTRRNYEITETLNLSNTLIPQEKLDDYLVQWAFAKE